MPLVASAGPVSWAHQNGSLQSNGAITVKSLAGGSYSGTTNPTGAVVKANQSAVTQPPTVIIQATGGSVFNYTTDCYIITTSRSSNKYIGAGKMVGNNFTGLLGGAEAGVAGATMMSMLTGAGLATPTYSSDSYGNAFAWCGNDSNCVWSYARSGSGSTAAAVAGVADLVTASWQKCYP